RLSVKLEAYERTCDPRLASKIAEEQQCLVQSSHALDQHLAEAVEQHYRNANLRVAITAEMFNRLMGGERNEVRPLRERIAGTPVWGRSHTHARNDVRLQPADDHWHLVIETRGSVDSNTLADGGPALVRSRSHTGFVV